MTTTMIPNYDDVAEMQHVRIQYDGYLPTTGRIGIPADGSIWILYDDQIFPNMEKLFNSDQTLYTNDLIRLESINN